MTAGDVTDRVGHRQYGQTKGEGYAEEAYAEAWETRC